MELDATRSDRSLLTGLTILVPAASPSEFTNCLQVGGAHVVKNPGIESGPPEDYAALDEAIENLFGYDWLLLNGVNAATYFLSRFRHLDNDLSKLDALQVCVIGNSTVASLQENQIHIDLVSDRLTSKHVYRALETYVSGRDFLSGLNFLVPRATYAKDHLSQLLGDAGARVDVVPAYRTVAANSSGLFQLKALLAGGGIDCAIFTSPADVRELAELLDTNDLARSLSGVVVVGIDDKTERAAGEFDLIVDIVPTRPTVPTLVHALGKYVRRTEHAPVTSEGA